MQEQTVVVEDIEACVREGRSPRDDAHYLVKFGDEQLHYREAVIEDPVPTGRQLLEAAGALPVVEYLLLEELRSGLLEQLGLDQTVDLRRKGVERFLVFRTDRAFFFVLDDRRQEWGARYINGYTLKVLAGVDPERYAVWQEMRDQPQDKLIGNKEKVDLAQPGVERFFTGLPKTTEGAEPILPLRDRRYLIDHGLAHEEVVFGTQHGVILRAFPLPLARFDADAADILILLPNGYPDVPPDMFYSVPWLRLKPGNIYPRAADQSLNFNGQNWQRWSRHNTDWRPGVDGIWTMLKRIEAALAEAA